MHPLAWQRGIGSTAFPVTSEEPPAEFPQTIGGVPFMCYRVQRIARLNQPAPGGEQPLLLSMAPQSSQKGRSQPQLSSLPSAEPYVAAAEALRSPVRLIVQEAASAPATSAPHTACSQSWVRGMLFL
mmetsp:Transcript_76582/g.151523  ORF Transcript_76582/g.151523 Transcript_76582/m.151523 type:complete len:127 (-) Transcript_76582:481-861(-)